MRLLRMVHATLVVLLCLVIVRTSSWQPPAGSTVWSVFGDLAARTKSCNLGQGFPDWDSPPFVLQSLRNAVNHQYTKPTGFPKLVELLAERYSTHLDCGVNPTTNVAVTVGASQALYLALRSILREGDEVLLFDPYFELYAKQIALVGATAKFIPLGITAEAWTIDPTKLRRAITPRTKVLILNSPHNPTGKVFSKAELELIAAVVREHPQITVLSDEVYKYIVYDAESAGDGPGSPVGHHHFARLPGMWDRTLTISSAGKTFSVTGWQVGWMVGPERLVAPVQAMLPCVQFCTPTPIQEALSQALVQADQPYEGHASYYDWLRAQFRQKRTLLESGLRSAGIEPLPSSGGFFLMARLPEVAELYTGAVDEPYDWRYCRYLAERYGVAGIPASPFFSRADYATSHGTGYLARFAFCKQDETLREAARRLNVGPTRSTATTTSAHSTR